MKKNKKVKVFLTILIFFMIIVLRCNLSKAAYISSDIDGINDNKYPGYKAKIQQLQQKYPNIKILYTGLDWDTVIKNEHDLVHGRNLVVASKGDEWICQECKKNGVLYDSGLYCASEDAVKYMMDTRNFLNETEIFQFQKLDTTVGTDTDELNKVLKVQKAIYLQDNNDILNAFANVAKKYKLNSYHLITRVIQEQGRTGTSPLSSGNGYTGNGYNEYGKGFYNLFSIKATRKTNDPVYMIYINALDTAKEKKWDTLAKSIEGGGEFVGDNYINVGQNTLYLQKFSVYNKKNQLYWHQYMQNLFGAQSEAGILRSCYSTTGIIDNKNFEFIIPVYENMPQEASKVPTLEYKGEINTDLIKLGTLVTEKGTYITGEMYIAEWVEGDCRKPTEKPTLTLKSTDNTVSIPLYVEYKDGIRYYFDKNIDAINIDMNKEYYIEAKLEGTKNIAESIKKKQNVRIPNQIIKENYNGRTIKIINNKIIFSEGEYRGDIETKLDEIKLVQNSLGETYIAGYVGIEEKINGTSRVPIAVPEIRIKSTDGTVDEKTYIEYKGGNKYYFDKNIERYDTSKEYYVEATLKGEENTSTNKTERVNISEGEVGTFNGKKVIVENGNILITYEGTVNTDLINMQIIQNGKGENYISGEIYIAEWINGECLNPSTKPKIILKSTDGTYEEKGYLEYRGGIKYYYDKNIEKIDLSKEYYLEIELTNPNNKAPKEAQRQKANIRQRGEVGKWTNGNKVTIEEGNIIKVEDVNTYYGTVNTDLINMQIIQNGKGENYISGEIYIAEWINGECLNPSTKPKIILKSTDGTYEEKGYLEYRGGIKYYYDKNIEKIDLSKEYYLEIELTNPNNKAPKEAQRQKANIRQRGEVGKWTNGNKVTIEEGNIIKVEDVNTYYGTVNTDLINMQIIQNGKGENYISGEIYIAEWINGECLNPSTKPKIILKSTDGTYEEKGYLEYRGGIKYYYDKNIEKIDLSKEYYLEIELTNPNNKAPKEAQRQKANIRQRGEVGKWTNGNKVTIEEGNIIKVEGINTNYGETNTDLINMQIIQNEKEENNITEETDEEINNNEVILNNQETEEEIDKDTKEDKEIKKKTNEETELKEEDKTINIDEEYSN